MKMGMQITLGEGNIYNNFFLHFFLWFMIQHVIDRWTDGFARSVMQPISGSAD